MIYREFFDKQKADEYAESCRAISRVHIVTRNGHVRCRGNYTVYFVGTESTCVSKDLIGKEVLLFDTEKERSSFMEGCRSACHLFTTTSSYYGKFSGKYAIAKV